MFAEPESLTAYDADHSEQVAEKVKLWIDEILDNL